MWIYAPQRGHGKHKPHPPPWTGGGRQDPREEVMQASVPVRIRYHTGPCAEGPGPRPLRRQAGFYPRGVQSGRRGRQRTNKGWKSRGVRLVRGRRGRPCDARGPLSTRARTHTHAQTHMHTQTRTHTHTHVGTHTDTCTHTHARTDAHAHTDTYTHTHT